MASLRKKLKRVVKKARKAVKSAGKKVKRVVKKVGIPALAVAALAIPGVGPMISSALSTVGTAAGGALSFIAGLPGKLVSTVGGLFAGGDAGAVEAVNEAASKPTGGGLDALLTSLTGIPGGLGAAQEGATLDQSGQPTTPGTGNGTPATVNGKKLLLWGGVAAGGLWLFSALSRKKAA